MNTHILLKRLDDIGRSLERSGHALALIGLGSVGQELERLDHYSDLDFFVIVEPGYKRQYLNDLEWLGSVCPLGYTFLNTADGYKALYSDGVFCEFAIFEPDELATIPFAAGRIVWKQSFIPDSISQPARQSNWRSKSSQEWLIGEALTNLYVGLGREKRGERLSAMRFIQGYAVDRLVELAELLETAQPIPADEFTPERRFEQRYPGVAGSLPSWTQGYEKNRESALAILSFLETHFPVNPAMAAAIRQFCE